MILGGARSLNSQTQKRCPMQIQVWRIACAKNLEDHGHEALRAGRGKGARDNFGSRQDSQHMGRGLPDFDSWEAIAVSTAKHFGLTPVTATSQAL